MKKHLAVLLSVLFLANIGFSQADRYTTLWEKSQASGNFPSFMGTAHTERGFGYGTVGANERIFLVSRLVGTKVVVLNAANGDSVGILSTTGVSGGTFTLIDADVSSDGKIFACNLTTASNTTAFKVYRWDNESVDPVAVIGFTTTTGYRLGDKFTVVGSTADNSITIWAAASSSDKVFQFNTTDNGVSFTATEITLSNGAQGSVLSVAPKGTGAAGFYMNSAGRNVVQFSATGTAIDTLSGGIVATGSTYLTYMSHSAKEYLAVYNYGTGHENIRFVEVTGGLATASLVFVTPSLGTLGNVNGTGDVGFKNNGDGTFNLYMLATNNGLAAYKTKVYANITFNAIMRIKILKGDFNPATDSVVVRGTFNNWSGEADRLTDPDGDSTYSVQKKYLPAGESIEFKFVMRKGGSDFWEGISNRQLTPAPGDNTYTAYFDNDSIYVQRFPIEFTFSCDMELERLSGRFNPAVDTVSVNGSFQGWTPKANQLLPNPLNPNIYEGTWTINAGVGENIEFKFWYTPNNWESIANRIYTFTAGNISSGIATYSGSFNNGTLETVLNQPATLKLTVYVPPTAVSAINGQPFPTLNTVHVAGSALPLQWPSDGWPDADSTKVLRLFDDGTNGDNVAGDRIFTRIITFPEYTVLSVKYKYGVNWGNAAANGGGNDNEAGFAQDHTLKMHRFLSSATVVDTFNIRPDSSWLKDIVLVGVEETPEPPKVYYLSQNYPNPFNPSTVIKFTVPELTKVTLKIYNLLGQEVATLINSQPFNAGEYSYNFNASNLSSGAYIYQITAGDFKQTKKMLLLK
ncbi:MAG: T9SS type A sorting domain-containing protein [Bacteroidetes bacterium]|nr:T9SS type A sorting domain-containing protein [Bacteroidota bacterium]MBU2586151.1 T9SS type A sorting domain-containing protein [Bacteroidota bacterium]